MLASAPSDDEDLHRKNQCRKWRYPVSTTAIPTCRRRRRLPGRECCRRDGATAVAPASAQDFERVRETGKTHPSDDGSLGFELVRSRAHDRETRGIDTAHLPGADATT